MDVQSKAYVALVIVALSGVATSSTAQSSPAMVPTVLAKAALGDYESMMGGLEFFVGRAPT